MLLIDARVKFADGALPENACTLDHLYEHGTPMRSDGTRPHAVVAACYRCNHRRGQQWSDILRQSHAAQLA